jgi:mycofactocin system creatininase family protein
VNLAETTSADVGATAPVLLVPIGSCEQHGPHLPLATDTIIAMAICERVAAGLPDTLVGPPMTVTASGEHAGFAGTLSIGTEVTAQVIIELTRSSDWARGLVLVNGHGGNRDAVRRALSTVRREGRRIDAWWPSMPGGDAHAGRTETSLMLAIRPELVRTDRLEPGDHRPLGEVASALRAGGIAAVSPSGVLGDPTAATLSEGNRLLDHLVDDLSRLITSHLRTWN